MHLKLVDSLDKGGQALVACDLFGDGNVRLRLPRRRLNEVLAFAPTSDVLKANLCKPQVSDGERMRNLAGKNTRQVLSHSRSQVAFASPRKPAFEGGRSEERGYGRSVSSSEVDDLDILALQFALTLCPSTRERRFAVDLGAGDGIGGTRFALLGLTTILYDFAFSDDVLVSPSYPIIDRRFVTRDLSSLQACWLPETIDLCYSHRALHYLHPAQMKSLLAMVRERTTRRAQAFLSVAGFDTEIGRSHQLRDMPVMERFGSISHEMQKRHSIRHPLCIFRKEEFVELVESAGYRAIKCWTSEFGNIKGSFAPK